MSVLVRSLLGISFALLASGGIPNCGSTTYNLGSGPNGLGSGGTAASGCELIGAQFTAFQNNFVAGNDPSDYAVNFGGASESAGPSATFSSGSFKSSTPGAQDLEFNYALHLDPADIPPGGGQWSVYSVTIDVAGASLGRPSVSALNSVVVQVDFCTNSTVFSCSITDPNFGVIAFVLNGGLGPISEFAGCYSNCTPIIPFNGVQLLSLEPGIHDIAFHEILKIQGQGNNTTNFSSTTVTLTQTAAPEPVTFALCGLGLVWFVVRRRR